MRRIDSSGKRCADLLPSLYRVGEKRHGDAIAGKRCASAPGTPCIAEFGFIEKAQQGVFVIALQRDQIAPECGFQAQDTVKHLPRRRATVDIVTQQHYARSFAGKLGIDADAIDQTLEMVVIAVDIADGIGEL